MSNFIVRSFLQARLHGLSPPLPTAWENAQSEPLNAPYQRVFLLPAQPTVHGISDHAHSRLSGILQVSLYYPLGEGTADVDERVAVINESFYAGLSVAIDGWQILIPHLPAQSTAQIINGEYVTHISIYYEAFEL